MKKIITFENLRSFAYCNDKICRKSIKGLAVGFFGLNGASMVAEDTEDGIRLALCRPGQRAL